MSNHHQLLVLGTGAVGQTVAYAGRKHGKTVAVVETQAPGGTCPNRGCDAKKPFVNAAALVHHARSLQAIGGGVTGELALDWPALVDFKRSFTDPVGELTTRDLVKAGITILSGRPTFIDARTVSVDGTSHTADQIVIATGQRPRTLDIPGGELTVDSDAFLELDDLPARVAFIGGGYIGMEFACVAAVADRHVTVLASREHVLDGFDADAVSTLEAGLKDLGAHGLHVVPQSRATSIQQTNDGLAVFADGPDPVAVVDLVVNATGRVASIDDLKPEAAGIPVTKAGIAVDQHLRSTGPHHVWAGGDVADNGRPSLIPTAAQDGRVIAHNLFAAAEDDLREQVLTPPASIAFTLPPIAAAGLTESEAREKHGDAITVTAGKLNTKKFFRMLGEQHAFYKLIFDPEGRLIGAHLTGPHAEEVINVFAVALGTHCNETQLCNATVTYPTVTAALQTAFRKADV